MLPPRKLAVILHADVAGSTLLVQKNESVAHARIQDVFRRFSSTITAYHGITRELRGDALVAEFTRASDAVAAALGFQVANAEANARLQDDLKPELRVGISLGEVVIADKTVTGAGVVLAQRVEQLADPGGVCTTGAIHEAVPKHLPFDFSDLGKQEIKGFEELVQVYSTILKAGERAPAPGPSDSAPSRSATSKRLWTVSAFAVLVLVAGALSWWQPWVRRQEPASIERMAFPLPSKPSIAVLPFTNMSDDREQEYFADGMTDDLTTALSKISSLFVIARNSTFTYKGKAVKVRQVAEELGVRYIMEGSVRRAGDQVRINAQLIDATTGRHLWAERYDGSLDDVFELQDTITQRIVAALEISLTVAEQERQARSETDSQAAYDAFLRGWSHYQRPSPDEFAQAIPFLEKAVALDPQYARAHAALAAIYWESWEKSWGKRLGLSLSEAEPKAREHLELALKDPTPLAYRTLAKIDSLGGHWDEAMAEAERAIALDPNDPSGYVAKSVLLVDVGRPADGLAFINKAMRLDPKSDYLYQLGDARFHMENYEEAATTLQKAAERSPEDQWIMLLLAATYGQLGRDQEANAAIETYKGLSVKLGLEPITLTQVNNWSYKHPRDRERLRTGLRKAGLPEGKAAPHVAALTSDELRDLFVGNTQVGQTAYGDTWTVYRAPDGKARMLYGGRIVEGSWEIVKGGISCRQWYDFGDGKKACWIYFKKGDVIEYWYSDGSGKRGEFKVIPGNPKNL